MNLRVFYHQEVNNLAWCIRSTSLLQSFVFPDAVVLDSDWCQAEFDWLLGILDADPQALIQAVQPSETHLRADKRAKWLGKQFEDYIAFWLNLCPRFELVARNALVSASGRTVGEFDFLYRDRQRQCDVHLEVACKFYLSKRNSRETLGFIGPSGYDRLNLKIEKLKLQMQLADTEEGAAVLAELGISNPERHVLVKGYIFHHYTEIVQAVPPRVASKGYCAGWYMFASEATHRFQDEAKWLPLPKSDWFSTIHVQRDDLHVLSSIEMMHYVEHHFNSSPTPDTRSLMVAQVDLTDEGWLEMHRGCIVHNRWPNRV